VSRARPARRLGRLLAADIARRCVGGRETLLSVAEALPLPSEGIFRQAALDGAFGRRLAENVPGGPIAAPVFIAQGDADDLVVPAIQRRFAASRCRAGQPLLYRGYPGLDHIALVAPDSPLGPDLVHWSRDRFAGRPAPEACPE